MTVFGHVLSKRLQALTPGGELPEALSSFALRYADQATKDWRGLKEAIARGHLESWNSGK